MAGPLTRDQFIELMEPTLHEVFTAGWDNDKSWESIVTKRESEKRREEVFEFVQPDVVIKTPEGSPYMQLFLQRAYTQASISTKFTGQIRATHEMIQDNFYDEIEEKTWGLGDAVARQMYEDAVGTFYNGFGLNSQNGDWQLNSPDGLSLFNSQHMLKKSASTYSNTTTSPLTSDSLNAGISSLMKTLNENGKVTPYGTNGIQLIVPPDLTRLAEQLCTGPYEPDTANFAVNVFKSKFKVEPITVPLLAEAPAGIAATQWYLRDPVKAKNYFFLREGPIFDLIRDPLTQDVLIQAMVRYSFLTSSWRGLYGSQG